ncbi:integration host factor subunit beta [Desulfopila sp. IMCC35006]|uniref:HU family DNA-binding protein n=1 Tax=Desulfopila sp. IMCC35006 TaxID=2569542 RepID=UPI0010AC78E8|nr:HU family DNA-binding protein [Desulfopila sp. IMCC35006]TKB24219.1 integration host factor subunit beta [Desulfopila sp. IMCC35006]
MNKSELIEALSEELNFSITVTQNIIGTILDSITEKLVAGESVEIRGFGSFSVRHYDSYIGRQPKTGEKIEVKSRKLPFFKVGKELKEAVDAGRK